jgi:Fe-S oxidoreductase
MLFQSIAKQQVERLNARVFQKILVSCPHCYNVLKHEYPGFGGKYEVLHHSQYFQQLLHSRNGKGSFSAFTRITYHDPCYLGRYQGVYTSPRYLLQAMKNSQFTELKDYGENSICCGGGGGHFWMDLENGSRITDIRIDQVVNSGANMVATACPYCLYMLQDVLRSKGLEEKIKVADIATLLLKTLE